MSTPNIVRVAATQCAFTGHLAENVARVEALGALDPVGGAGDGRGRGQPDPQ